MKTDSGLEIITIEEGSGPQPQPGDIVSVHYVGTLADGTEFDNSYSRGAPLEFPIGEGRVIKGWDEGIGLLKVGGKATLIIPPALGYGARGAGAAVPPNATLHFDVELVGVKAAPQIGYKELKAGSGPAPKRGDMVRVHYVGTLENGKEFDNSYKRGEPLAFPLGMGRVIQGWDKGIARMKVGGKAQLTIPPELGYGARGAGGAIPPNATLIFRVELVGIG